MKEPFSLEELTSSKYITFMERALPSALDSARNFGLSFASATHDQRMTWSLGIFAPTDDGGEFFSKHADFNVSGRVTGLPLYADEGRRLIHLGVAGAYQARDDFGFRLRRRPEVHLAERYVDTGVDGFGDPLLASNGNALLGLEAAAVFGPVHLTAEWKQTWIDLVGSGTDTAYGGYVTFGVFLTGEHRPYEKSNGTWTRVDPVNPFDPDQGDWGAFELATRYSYLDINDGNLNGGREQNVGLALNWYLFSNVRLSANYVYSDVRDTGDFLGGESGDIHSFQTRAQIEF